MAQLLSGHRILQRAQGHMPCYRPGSAMPCPGCGGHQWHVGRQTAECAICTTALPLADKGDRGLSAVRPQYDLLKA